MANRYKIPVPLFSSDGVTQEATCQPPVGGGLSSQVDISGKSGMLLTLSCDGERSLRTKELTDVRLPGKASKRCNWMTPVPQSDTGR